jgi:uncharacterized protein YndB with AHSA1/START domain
MTENAFGAGPLAQVECLAHEQGWTLVFVQELRHPPEAVWSALTDPAELDRWSPFTASRNLDAPGEATLTMVDGDTREELAAVVTRAERPRLLEYIWGADLLCWELAAIPSGTRLTLRHTVESLDWVPKVAAGWHLCLVVAGRLLDGAPTEPIRGQAAMAHGWAELRDAYAERLGLAGAGTPGR